MEEPKILNDISSDNSSNTTQIKPGENTKLAKALEAAKQEISTLILPEDSIYALNPVLKARLKKLTCEHDEEIIFVVAQSKLHGLNPGFIVFTDKKIVLAEPSIMHFLNIQLMAFKSFDFIQYVRITDLSAKRGMYMRSLFIKISGGETKEISGIKPSDVELILKFMLKVVEYLET